MSEKYDEEEPFQKIRFTLSEVAIEKIAILRNWGYFRSDSATVEECIRSMYEIAEEIRTLMAEGKEKNLTTDERLNTLLRIAIRTRRFVPKSKTDS